MWPLVDSLYPYFGLLVMFALGFKARVDLLLACQKHKKQDSPPVWPLEAYPRGVTCTSLALPQLRAPIPARGVPLGFPFPQLGYPTIAPYLPQLEDIPYLRWGLPQGAPPTLAGRTPRVPLTSAGCTGGLPEVCRAAPAPQLRCTRRGFPAEVSR